MLRNISRAQSSKPHGYHNQPPSIPLGRIALSEKNKRTTTINSRWEQHVIEPERETVLMTPEAFDQSVWQYLQPFSRQFCRCEIQMPCPAVQVQAPWKLWDPSEAAESVQLVVVHALQSGKHLTWPSHRAEDHIHLSLSGGRTKTGGHSALCAACWSACGFNYHLCLHVNWFVKKCLLWRNSGAILILS